MLPSLYISHGSPALMIKNNKTTEFLKQLSSKFEKPKYILIISSHWVSKNLKILYEDSPSLIYDFYGFPNELYTLKYPAKSSKRKSNEIVELLESNNIKIEKDDLRGGFDHGVWSPLTFLYPKADIPVLQISLPASYSAEQLYKVGEILSKLRDDTLIIGSGSITHNLGDISWDENNNSPKPYVKAFRDWVVEKIENQEIDSLLNFRKESPYLAKNHPTLEHFLPLYVSLGAAKGTEGKSLNDLYMHGNLSMDTIIFEQ